MLLLRRLSLMRRRYRTVRPRSKKRNCPRSKKINHPRSRKRTCLKRLKVRKHTYSRLV